MGTIAADALIDRASIQLVDKGLRRWPQHELIGWANDGQLAIVQLRPEAYIVKRALKLVAGTRQALPADGLRLVDIPRNLGADGATPGRACRYVERDQLDLADPDWHSKTANATVLHWLYSLKVPKAFWVYPQQPASAQGHVELDLSVAPPALTIDGLNGANATSTLALDDTWINALVQFCIYRAYSKDAEYTQAGGKADLAYREFVQLAGAQA